MMSRRSLFTTTLPPTLAAATASSLERSPDTVPWHLTVTLSLRVSSTQRSSLTLATSLPSTSETASRTSPSEGSGGRLQYSSSSVRRGAGTAILLLSLPLWKLLKKVNQ